jgi:hypothetical protein
VGHQPQKSEHRLVDPLLIDRHPSTLARRALPHAVYSSISWTRIGDITLPAAKRTSFVHSLKNAFALGGTYCLDVALINSLASARWRSSVLANDQCG